MERKKRVSSADKVKAKKYVRLGVNTQEKCNLKEALVLFEKATKIDPDCIDAWKHKAELLEKLGKYKEAKRCYKRLLEYCHKDFKTLIDNASTYSCILVPRMTDKQKEKEELKIIDKLLEKRPRSIELWLIKVDIVSYLFGDAKALKLADEVLQRFPQSYKVWEEKFHLLLLSEKHNELIEHYNNWLEKFPNDTIILHNEANELRGLGRFDEALICWEKFVKRDKCFREEALENIAEILIETKKYEEAIKTLDKLLGIRHRIGTIYYTPFSSGMPEIRPNYLNVWLLKARAFKGLKRYREAIECYEIVERMSLEGYRAYNSMMREKRGCLHKLAVCGGDIKNRK